MRLPVNEDVEEPLLLTPPAAAVAKGHRRTHRWPPGPHLGQKDESLLQGSRATAPPERPGVDRAHHLVEPGADQLGASADLPQLPLGRTVPTRVLVQVGQPIGRLLNLGPPPAERGGAARRSPR